MKHTRLNTRGLNELEEMLRQVAENHFGGQDCAKNCVEVNILRAKVNNAFMIIGILLGSLLSLNGVIFMKINTMDTTLTSKISQLEASEAGLVKRIDQHRTELSTIESWHVAPNQDKHK